MMLICTSAAAQRIVSVQEEMLPVAIDTLDAGRDNRKVIIFADNTWQYYYPDLQEKLSLQIYNDHWINDQIFAYRDVKPEQLPQTMDIDLISDYADYHAPAVGKVYSKYGTRGRRRHQGVDIPMKSGDPIYASFSGKVRYSSYNTGGYGNLVIIRHENGLETWYAHLTKRNVEVDEYVSAGTVIGYCGSTGRSKGVHLHFEVRYCDQSFDPEHIIDFSTGDLRYWTFPLQRSYFSSQSRASETLEETDDYEETLLAADSLSGDLTSEAILDNIRSADNAVQEKPKTAANPVYYSVRKGDTLSKIARQHGTTVKKLCQLNGIKETSILSIGRKLRVK